MSSHTVITLTQDTYNKAWEVNIKMFDSNGREFFDLDQYFPSQMAAIKFINNWNNARQELTLTYA